MSIKDEQCLSFEDLPASINICVEFKESSLVISQEKWNLRKGQEQKSSH